VAVLLIDDSPVLNKFPIPLPNSDSPNIELESLSEI
jgi:hypothetical protein